MYPKQFSLTIFFADRILQCIGPRKIAILTLDIYILGRNYFEDVEWREFFALHFLARIKADKEWPWNILWSDEAHFHLQGFANTQNCTMADRESVPGSAIISSVSKE